MELREQIEEVTEASQRNKQKINEQEKAMQKIEAEEEKLMKAIDDAVMAIFPDKDVSKDKKEAEPDEFE